MYISKELHDAICEAGVWGIAITLGAMILAVFIPWVWKRTWYYRARIMLWVRYKRDVHRYKAAMRVFDKPVRWCEK
jgi:hypothetical protein